MLNVSIQKDHSNVNVRQDSLETVTHAPTSMNVRKEFITVMRKLLVSILKEPLHVHASWGTKETVVNVLTWMSVLQGRIIVIGSRNVSMRRARSVVCVMKVMLAKVVDSVWILMSVNVTKITAHRILNVKTPLVASDVIASHHLC